MNYDSLIISVDKNLGDHSFADSKYLRNVVLFGRNSSLGVGVFSYCSNIQSVQMYNVSKIGEGAFAWCEKLENITLDVFALEKDAFFQCKSLKEVTFSEKLEKLGERSFFGCDKLKKVLFLGKPPVMNGVFEHSHDELEIFIKRKYEDCMRYFISENIEKIHVFWVD